jgi:hypothetical protein
MDDNNEILDLLKVIENTTNALKIDIQNIKSMHQEDHLLLKVFEQSSSINKAEHDKINNELAHIQGDISYIKETNKSLLEMYGEHEAEIRSFRRRSV